MRAQRRKISWVTGEDGIAVQVCDGCDDGVDCARARAYCSESYAGTLCEQAIYTNTAQSNEVVCFLRVTTAPELGNDGRWNTYR
jgi:hypothetical protein